MLQKNNSDEIKELEERWQKRQIVDDFIKELKEQIIEMEKPKTAISFKDSNETSYSDALYVALFVMLVVKLEFLLKNLLTWMNFYYCQKWDYQQYKGKTLGGVIEIYQTRAFQMQIKNLKDKIQPDVRAKLLKMFLNESNSKILFVEDCLKINNLRNNLYHSNLLAGENNHKNNKNLQQIIKEIKQCVSLFKESYLKGELDRLITSKDINDISNDIQSGLLDYLIQIIKEIEYIIFEERKKTIKNHNSENINTSLE
ncbi:MAG: hypothetical protein KBG30_09335 [Bacteroidales bacterium]|nr:hypothetical protein [Bacteroidales bacterium]